LKSKRKDLEKILNEHSIWVLSLGKVGKLADIKNWKLDKTDLKMAVIDLIEKVKSNIQLDQVKAICKNQHGIEKIDKIDCIDGDIVTHNDQVAFKLDFKISYNLSLLLDRNGNFIKKADLNA
jgi:histidyl-tRNA synthetase